MSYIVSTKCGRYKEGFDFSAERVTRSIDESLERLQLDYIVTETIPALVKLKEAGKAKFTYVLDRVPPGTVDVILSYCHYGVNDSTLEDLIPYLKSKASVELKAACQDAAAYCKEKGKNISKLSLQYSLSNKDISILVGMNSVTQVDENVELQ
ncbi:L-galactose dehydrogenase-like [Salvia miltiorrhiza]|uniref:L-galactose dehydrogenase-like n=1 Tax=Salvia miltiorrhiza TaxID=226208 RepID=UPI0025AD23DB|nr:L-galactose dehydrogenase-like [Salvia miltiorrhiza]